MSDIFFIDPSDPDLEAKCRARGIDVRTTVERRHSGPDVECVNVGAGPEIVNHLRHSVRSHLGFNIGDRVRLNAAGLQKWTINTPEKVSAQVNGVKLLEILPDPEYPNDPELCLVEIEKPLNGFLDLSDIEKVS